MKGMKKTLIGLSTLGLLTALSSQAYASGYKLEFQSPSTLADAGDAAVVNDASTNWYNSAGLVKLPQQLVASGIDIFSNTQFQGNATPTTPGLAPTMTGTARSTPHAYLPAFHYALPINDRISLGLSAVPSFGLQEFYGNNDSIVRYDLIRVYTKTIDIAPSIAYRITKQWSIGAGPDFNYFQILSKANSYLAPTGAIGDGQSRYSADAWNEGYHIGALFEMNDATRFGLNYRSKILMNLRGYSSFVANGGLFNGMNQTNQFSLGFPLPAVTTLSAYRDINPAWAMMGTLSYDQWGLLNTYHANNFAQPAGVTPSTVQVNLPAHMHNTVDIGIGTHYKLNDKILLRASFKYEPTPTSNSYRDIANPDAPKYGVNLGARYTLNKKLAFDFIYAHVFTPSVAINNTNPVSGATVSGTSRTHIDLVGASIVWNI